MTTLVLGPSLGTSAAACWGPVLPLLPAGLDVVAYDLPGHGDETGLVESPLTAGDLARRVLERVDGPFVCAGVSVGGAVGLQLLLDAPDRVLGAVLCCTGARIGDARTWDERVAQVRAGGTGSLEAATPARWFAPGAQERDPVATAALLDALRRTDDDGYVAVCGLLRSFDVRARLGEITAPVVAVAGAHDRVCPPSSLEEIAGGVRDGRLVVLDDVAHQAPVEAPAAVAGLLRQLVEEVA